MRWEKITICCLAAAMPLMVFAEPPAGGAGKDTPSGGRDKPRGPTHNNPASNPGDRGGPQGSFGGPGGVPGGGMGGRSGWDEMNDTERKAFRVELEKFCSENSPNRWKEMKDIPGSKLRMSGLAMRFRMLQFMEKDDKSLWQIKVDQIKVEDREFGYVIEMGKAGPTTEISAGLKTCAREYHDLRHKERTLRLNRLKDILTKEEIALATDLQNIEKLSEDRAKEILEKKKDFFLPPQKRGDGRGPNDKGDKEKGDKGANDPAGKPAIPINAAP